MKGQRGTAASPWNRRRRLMACAAVPPPPCLSNAARTPCGAPVLPVARPGVAGGRFLHLPSACSAPHPPPCAPAYAGRRFGRCSVASVCEDGEACVVARTAADGGGGAGSADAMAGVGGSGAEGAVAAAANAGHGCADSTPQCVRRSRWLCWQQFECAQRRHWW